MGIALNNTFTSQPELIYADGQIGKIFLLKFAYTKSRDFSLGLEWGYMITPMPGVEKDPAAQTIGFASRYFF